MKKKEKYPIDIKELMLNVYTTYIIRKMREREGVKHGRICLRVRKLLHSLHMCGIFLLTFVICARKDTRHTYPESMKRPHVSN